MINDHPIPVHWHRHAHCVYQIGKHMFTYSKEMAG